MSFLVLLLIAVVLRLVGTKLVPVVMPTSRFKTIALAWLGAFLGNLFLHIGPQIAGVHLVPALTGAALCVLTVGVAPFVKILLGKV